MFPLAPEEDFVRRALFLPGQVRNKVHSVRYASEVNEMQEQIEIILDRINASLDQR